MDRLYVSPASASDFKLKCNVCKVMKHTDEMCADKSRATGYRNMCKACMSEYKTQYYQQNLSKIKEQRRVYNTENKYSAIHYQKNKDKVKEINALYYENNKDAIIQRTKEYNSKNKESIARRQAIYVKNRSRTDVNYRIKVRMRNRLNKALKGGYKSGSAVRDLGCSIEELKIYLESKFQPGMTWDNWSPKGWHIDHIVPLDEFDLTDREQLLKACHYSNLQPLWAKDNLRKGNGYPGSMPLL